jgi:hypothetical protein
MIKGIFFQSNELLASTFVANPQKRSSQKNIPMFYIHEMYDTKLQNVGSIVVANFPVGCKHEKKHYNIS